MNPAVPASDSPQVRAQLEIFERGVVDLIEKRELSERIARSLQSGKPLRIKFGMDPSSPDLHVGHCVPLMKLRDLQQLGHQIVLIVGDATAMVGDPSGRNKLRPQLSRAEVEINLQTYVEQAAKVLDMSRTEVRRNSEWFDAMRFEDVLRLCGKMTVARMLERDTFQKRVSENEPIGIHEFLYPLMQGWDSVMIRCDAELGGTDQLFNLLRGRDLQAGEGQTGQVCFTTPLVNGLDGRKMSKSYGNAITLTDSARDMFGKVMSIPDEVMRDWFLLLTRVPMVEVDALLAGGFREAKARLGQEIAGFFHGALAGRAAREAFDRQFRDKQLPSDIPELAYPAGAPEQGWMLPNLLKELKLVASTSDARRMIEQGGVKLDGEPVKDAKYLVSPKGMTLLVQAGKLKFARVKRG
ncbi:MAG: tyrosine--tRNA ligase [Planctomycetes bacterium]|nr:tyrosine--tRNA ligase [Planctomycetota bacterium]